MSGSTPRFRDTRVIVVIDRDQAGDGTAEASLIPQARILSILRIGHDTSCVTWAIQPSAVTKGLLRRARLII